MKQLVATFSAVRVVETVLFVVSFVLVLVGAGLLFADLRRTTHTLRRVDRRARGISEPGMPIGEITHVVLDDEMVAREALSDLAGLLGSGGRRDRLGAYLGAVGAACALAGSLLAVWR